MSFDTLTANALFEIAQTQSQAAKLNGDLSKIPNGKNAARQAADDFEAVFLNTIMESMWVGIETDGPFGGGHGEKVYRSMLNEEYSKAITQSGGIGIADQLYREILMLQEQSQSET